MSVPEALEVEQFADTAELDEVREFSDRVGDDVCAVSALVPRLFADEFLGAPEQECFDDESLVEVFVELIGVLFPFRGRIVTEVDEVLLCPLADGVRKESPSVLVLCEVGLGDELLSRILEEELVALCRG